MKESKVSNRTWNHSIEVQTIWRGSLNHLVTETRTTTMLNVIDKRTRCMYLLNVIGKRTLCLLKVNIKRTTYLLKVNIERATCLLHVIDKRSTYLYLPEQHITWWFQPVSVSLQERTDNIWTKHSLSTSHNCLHLTAVCPVLYCRTINGWGSDSLYWNKNCLWTTWSTSQLSVKYMYMINNLHNMIIFTYKQEFVTELPTSPTSGKFYMKRKIVLFQKIEVWSPKLWSMLDLQMQQ
jgi:hypothetical protein